MEIMKYDWKKTEKIYYEPKTEPILLLVPPMKYFAISGTGDPNGPEFADVVGALYSLSYAIKMMPKSGVTPPGYVDYTVFPLEGVWDIADVSQGFSANNKDNLKYDAMIRQPDFVTDELAAETIAKVMAKKPNPQLTNAVFKTVDDGLCVQILHIGTYDDEPRSFERIHEFCAFNGLERIGKTHREIYLSDPRKSAPDKLRTTLRCFVGN
jgi:hypothetical protein